jgi:hypothetical protein
MNLSPTAQCLIDNYQGSDFSKKHKFIEAEAAIEGLEFYKSSFMVKFPLFG